MGKIIVGLRKLEVLKPNAEWEPSELVNIEKNDVFRLFEPDGTLVKIDGKSTRFRAVSNAYYSGEDNTTVVDVQGLDW